MGLWVISYYIFLNYNSTMYAGYETITNSVAFEFLAQYVTCNDDYKTFFPIDIFSCDFFPEIFFLVTVFPDDFFSK